MHASSVYVSVCVHIFLNALTGKHAWTRVWLLQHTPSAKDASSGQTIAALRQLRNPEATKEQFQQACADAQLTFVDTLPEKYNTFVGAGLHGVWWQ